MLHVVLLFSSVQEVKFVHVGSLRCGSSGVLQRGLDAVRDAAERCATSGFVAVVVVVCCDADATLLMCHAIRSSITCSVSPRQTITP